jgi:hypothetical protein
VLAQLLQAGVGAGDFAAMAGQEALPGAGGEAGQRGDIGSHVTIGGRDQRRGPAHDMIAGKKRLAERKAEMAR